MKFYRVIIEKFDGSLWSTSIHSLNGLHGVIKCQVNKGYKMVSVQQVAVSELEREMEVKFEGPLLTDFTRLLK